MGKCETCEGKGKIVTGLTSKFDAKNMELYDVDVWGKCPDCDEDDVIGLIGSITKKAESINELQGENDQIDRLFSSMNDIFSKKRGF